MSVVLRIVNVPLGDGAHKIVPLNEVRANRDTLCELACPQATGEQSDE
jgi:hypothetical protein